MIGHLFNSQTQKIVTNETLKIFEKAKYGFYKLKNFQKVRISKIPD